MCILAISASKSKFSTSGLMLIKVKPQFLSIFVLLDVFLHHNKYAHLHRLLLLIYEQEKTSQLLFILPHHTFFRKYFHYWGYYVFLFWLIDCLKFQDFFWTHLLLLHLDYCNELDYKQDSQKYTHFYYH